MFLSDKLLLSKMVLSIQSVREMSQVTLLLEAAQRGEPGAWDQLLPLVYIELRNLAAIKLASESSDKTLQPTALVHEVYLRLLGHPSGENPLLVNQRHFFAAAAESMRRILIERARARKAIKRGGEQKRIAVDLNLLTAFDEEHFEEILYLDEALQELAHYDPKIAQLIQLRFFAGLTHSQAAEAMGITRREADRLWTLGKAWLFRWLKKD